MDKAEPKYASVLHQPVFDQLEGCSRILIAGCGGGYDFFAGIPLYFALRKAGAECFLANLTFSDSNNIDAEEVSTNCWKITANSRRKSAGWTVSREHYWPELKVAQWLHKNEGIEAPVFMFAHEIGVQPLKFAYEKIVTMHNIDAILLVDGGTDSIMFGNEAALGTPVEDMTSICAVNLISNVKKKILFNIGFGVDSFHGVCHSSYLENVATIARAGGFYGSFSLLSTHQEAQKLKAIFEACDPDNSIVCSSVLSAVEGAFGNTHSKYTNRRTAGSILYISAIMSMYWAFDLSIVASHVLYLDRLKDTQFSIEVTRAVNEFRQQFYKNGAYVGLRPDKKMEY